MLQIIEMETAPEFSVIDSDTPFDTPLFETESLCDAVVFCYVLGVDFEVRTLAAWRAKNAN